MRLLGIANASSRMQAPAAKDERNRAGKI